MEKIGNTGWFLTNEEYERISNAIIVIQEIVDSVKCKQGHADNIALKQKEYESNEFAETTQTHPCPNCPWKDNWKPWTNPVDWRWRPEQAPWYGEPIDFKRYEVGDGEWWKHQRYCTSTTEDNPNIVKETKTTGDGCVDPEFIDKLRNFAKADPSPTKE